MYATLADLEAHGIYPFEDVDAALATLRALESRPGIGTSYCLALIVLAQTIGDALFGRWS